MSGLSLPFIMGGSNPNLIHCLPSIQITRVGEYYPPDKYILLNTLQGQSRTYAPFALSTIPLKSTRWDFKYPDMRAVLTMDDRPVPIRLICIIDEIGFNHSPKPYMTVHPLYHNDAALADKILAEHKEFDPELDDDYELCPVHLSIPVKDPPEPSPFFENFATRYKISVYDNTLLRLDAPSPLKRIPPGVLKRNDLIITTCHLYLQANPMQGQATYELVVEDIGLVHAARDMSSGIDLDRE
ncbi:hypothetical protein GY45DRAFT_1372442 [Cubamyces sp. BRFM 1775]|nr:hypothetical protein GY45DRAFT_1372442 [Cubamyces sp. BRFM 1775]